MPKSKEKNLIRSRDGLKRFSIDMLVLLVALLGAACYLNGLNALWRALIACASAVACELAGRLIFGCPGTLRDLSAVTAGLMLALMLPAACPLWLPALGAAFSIAVVKIPFGGARKAPFVPAAAGWCFLAVCFPSQVFTCAAVNVGVSSPVYGSEGFVSGTTVASMLRVGQSLSLNLFGASDILTGKISGAMGTTCMFAMVGVAVYLLFKRPARLVVSAGFLASCTLMALLFPRVLSGAGTSVAMELGAGSLVFVALLVLNDPVTSPKKPLASLVYGVVAGILCMVLRYYGKYEDSSCFSVLIMNAVWPVVDDYRIIIKKALKTKSEREAVAQQRGKANKQLTAKTEPAAQPAADIAKEEPAAKTENNDTAKTSDRRKSIYDVFVKEVKAPAEQKLSDNQKKRSKSQHNAGAAKAKGSDEDSFEKILNRLLESDSDESDDAYDSIYNAQSRDTFFDYHQDSPAPDDDNIFGESLRSYTSEKHAKNSDDDVDYRKYLDNGGDDDE